MKRLRKAASDEPKKEKEVLPKNSETIISQSMDENPSELRKRKRTQHWKLRDSEAAFSQAKKGSTKDKLIKEKSSDTDGSQDVGDTSTAKRAEKQHKVDCNGKGKSALEDRGHIALNKLKPYDRQWTIKVRVLRKGTIETYRNPKGTGRFRSVVLLDNEGSLVTAVMFNEVIDQFEDSLARESTYYISNGNVKKVNSNYANAHNKIELTITADTRVELALGSVNVDCMSYKFISFVDLHLFQNSLVDILATVIDVDPLTQCTKSTTGKILHKRNITLKDPTSQTIVLTLWEDLSIEEGKLLEENIVVAPIVAISKVKVTEYKGILSLSSMSFTTVVIDPSIDEVSEFKKRANHHDSLTKSSIQFTATPKDTEEMELSDLLDRELSTFKSIHCSFRATIIEVPNASEPWYKACKSCTKSVYLDDGVYHCAKCGKSNAPYKNRYNLRLVVDDGKRSATVTMFDAAEYIINCAVADLCELPKEQQEARLQKSFNSIVGARFMFYTRIDKTAERNRSIGNIIATLATKDDQG